MHTEEIKTSSSSEGCRHTPNQDKSYNTLSPYNQNRNLRLHSAESERVCDIRVFLWTAVVLHWMTHRSRVDNRPLWILNVARQISSVQLLLKIEFIFVVNPRPELHTAFQHGLVGNLRTRSTLSRWADNHYFTIRPHIRLNFGRLHEVTETINYLNCFLSSKIDLRARLSVSLFSSFPFCLSVCLSFCLSLTLYVRLCVWECDSRSSNY